MVQLGELMMILELHRQGLSVTAIARRTGRDPENRPQIYRASFAAVIHLRSSDQFTMNLYMTWTALKIPPIRTER